MDDSSTGLTYAALTGQRKQSVTDAERLFGAGVLSFMQKKNYKFETKYVEIVLNWRRAGDERGLSELQRSRYNYSMINFILDELLPWHNDNYDLSSLEVNQ